jgi:hypothetical protein
MGALDNLLGGSSGSSTPDSTYTNKVYMGSTPTVKGVGGGVYLGRQLQAPKAFEDDLKSIADVKNSFYTWDDRTLNNFMTRLKKYGYNDVTLPKAKSIWDMAVDGSSSWLSGSKGARKVTPDQYIEWYSKGANTQAGPSVSKNIYQYDPVVLGGLVDNIYQKTIGELPTAKEKAARLKELQVLINKGTVSKTVKDKSGMSVTTTTPGFTQEQAQLSITEKLKQENPDDYDRQKRIDFDGWLSQNVQGA